MLLQHWSPYLGRCRVLRFCPRSAISMEMTIIRSTGTMLPMPVNTPCKKMIMLLLFTYNFPTSINQPKRDVTGAAAGTWYYRVQAVNTNGASAWSNVVSTTVKPEPPVLDPITNPGNSDAFSISWSSVAAADGYLLLEADNGSFIGATTKYQGTDTSYAVTGQAGGTWYYHVRAYNAGGDSDWSNTETVTVTYSTLSSPNLLPIVNPNKESSFSVNWSDVLSATSYILEESDNPVFR